METEGAFGRSDRRRAALPRMVATGGTLVELAATGGLFPHFPHVLLLSQKMNRLNNLSLDFA